MWFVIYRTQIDHLKQSVQRASEFYLVDVEQLNCATCKIQQQKIKQSLSFQRIIKRAVKFIDLI